MPVVLFLGKHPSTLTHSHRGDCRRCPAHDSDDDVDDSDDDAHDLDDDVDDSDDDAHDSDDDADDEEDGFEEPCYRCKLLHSQKLLRFYSCR